MSRKTIEAEPLHNHQDIIDEERRMYVADGMIFVKRLSAKGNAQTRFHQPYRSYLPRLARVLSGWGRYVINLEEQMFRKGDIAILSANAIMQIDECSDDYALAFVSLDDTDPALKDIQTATIHLEQPQLDIIDGYFRLIGNILFNGGYQKPVIAPLQRSLIQTYLAYRNVEMQQTEPHASRQSEVFHRFLSLVSQHAAEGARDIQFYADRLCLAPRYLCAVVKEASGQTIMQWVERAVVSEAKVELCYTDRPVSDIAHQLHFDDASTFTRYFRRVTGMTPSEYREK